MRYRPVYLFFCQIAQWRRTDLTDPLSEYFWSEWGECDRSCGPGTMRKQRECIRLTHGLIPSVELLASDICGVPPPGAESDEIERECFLRFCGMFVLC